MKAIFFSGPSGMAKTTIIGKLLQLAPVLDLSIERTVLTTPRKMRAGESQGHPWYFESLQKMEEKQRQNPQHYLLQEIRPGEVQGLDAGHEIKSKALKADILWCELNSSWLRPVEKWVHDHMPELPLLKVFIAPLSQKELERQSREQNCSWRDVLRQEMLKRLYARRRAGLDNMSDDTLLMRADHAVTEYEQRNKFDCIVINGQGEESPQWGEKNEFPTAEAAVVLNQIIALLKTKD